MFSLSWVENRGEAKEDRMQGVRTDQNSIKSHPKSSFYFWNGSMMYVGDKIDTSAHQQHVTHIIIGLNRSFQLHIHDQICQCRLAIIAADVSHRFLGSNDWHTVIKLDPQSEVSRRLAAKHLKGHDFRILDISLVEEFVSELHHYIGQVHSGNDAKSLLDRLTASLAGTEHAATKIDSRIQKALDLIKQLPVKKITAKEISSEIGLSESRLIHLFKEQVGIPIRRYLLWLRLCVAIEKVTHCGSLTCAAHRAEFADSAHLSRTFRRMFGLTMSEVFKRPGDIQIIPHFCHGK